MDCQKQECMFIINCINKKKQSKGRKPLWQKTIFENVKDINNFEELYSFLQKNPNLFITIQQTILKMEHKQKEKLNMFMSLQKKIESYECDKPLFKKIIEFPEIFISEKVLHILLKCMNGLSVTIDEYDFIKNYLTSLNLMKNINHNGLN